MTNEELIMAKIAKLQLNLPAAIALDAGKEIEILATGEWSLRDSMPLDTSHEYRPKPEPINVWLAVYSIDGVDWTGSKYLTKQACEAACGRVPHFVRAGCFVEVLK